ncbi:MAG: alpha/beta hydrolase [Acidimicrobiia bacterium]
MGPLPDDDAGDDAEPADAGSAAPYRVVLLHGHGELPSSLDHVAAELRRSLGVGVVQPAGGHRVPAGLAWWPDGHEEPDERSVSELAAAGNTFIGFSQGGAMALAVAAQRLQRGDGTARAVVVGGFLPGSAAVPSAPAQVLVVHGDDDTVVDPFHAELVVRRCRRNGCTVSLQHHDGGHEWGAAVTAAVLDWLRSTAGTPAAGTDERS